MFTKRFPTQRFLLPLALLVLLLAGCYRPGETSICSGDEITWIENFSPFDRVVDTVTPTLTWSYPDEDCRPDHYEIEIHDKDTVRRVPREERVGYSTPIYTAETTELYYTIPAAAGLQPGQTYFVSISSIPESGAPVKQINWFTIGPLCGESESLQAVTLIYPPDNALVYFPSTVALNWNNPMSCTPAGDYYLQISTTEDFSDMTWWGRTHNREAVWISNGPPMFSDCTRYYWRVRSDPAGGGEGPVSETWSFLMSWSEVFCPLEREPVFEDTPITIPPLVELISDASCRAGPSLDYPVLAYLESGQSAPIDGQNEAGDWWHVLPPETQTYCWVSNRVVRLSGDFFQVPFIPVDPPPAAEITDTPAYDCSQYNTNPTACTTTASNACRWDASIFPNGACVNR